MKKGNLALAALEQGKSILRLAATVYRGHFAFPRKNKIASWYYYVLRANTVASTKFGFPPRRLLKKWVLTN